MPTPKSYNDIQIVLPAFKAGIPERTITLGDILEHKLKEETPTLTIAFDLIFMSRICYLHKNGPKRTEEIPFNPNNN